MNVRRLFINVDPLIYDDPQWAVFQSNEPLFTPTAPKSSMPHNDIDNGRSICVVGIAPLRLVKFVIFRTRQKWVGGGVGAERAQGCFWG